MTRPEHTRTHDPDFVQHCAFSSLQDRLPLRWPTPPDTPPSPKKRYRSGYRYLGWQDLSDLAHWANDEDFDLLLRLIDFSPLRNVLALRLEPGSNPAQPEKTAFSGLCHPLWFSGGDISQRRGLRHIMP
jgi:hypothetical protein